MKKIRCCIVGCGNCASALIQGLEYYKDVNDNEQSIPGLMNPVLGGYKISDIEVVVAFDVDKRKIGKDISQAIFEQPNCTKRFSDVPILNIEVMKCPVLDGIADHMHDYFQTDENQKELSKEEIISILKERNTDIIINYLPVGSRQATEFWADIAIETKCGFINAIPVFIASNPEWSKKFEDTNLPIIGDDVKSQLGATEMHRVLTQMIIDRGGKIDNTWQLNVGGNSDFLNMTDSSRLTSKRISKTESIKSLIPYDAYVYAGPNGFIECLKDNKICHLRIDFCIFGDIPCSIDCKLSVEDSPNSAGILIDAIRVVRLALDNGIGGVLIGPSAWFMKHPSIQMKDEDARVLLNNWVNDIHSAQGDE